MKDGGTVADAGLDQSAAWLILNRGGRALISLGLRAQLLPLRVPAGT